MVAEDETKRISKRIKNALAVSKEKGTELGKHGKYVLSKQNKENADQFAISLIPIITEIKKSGYKTQRAITDQLNIRNIPTFREGSKWHHYTTHKLLKRIESLS